MSKPTPLRGPSAPRPGTLSVVATPIGNLGDLSARAAATLSEVDVVCCEDTRHTGRLLELAGISARRMLSLHAHNEAERIGAVLSELAAGRTVALVSDAGTPLVSDPGARLVAAVLDAGFGVVAVPGPSAVLSALAVSGFDTERFGFEGFLPRSGKARDERLAQVASASAPSVLFESPRRVVATLRDIVETSGPERRVVVGRELTKLHEEVWRGRAHEVLERASRSDPIGEYALVVDGAPRPPTPDQASARTALLKLVDAGLDLKDATRAVEVLLGVPHRVAYAAALELRAAGDGEGTPTGRVSRRSSPG